MSGTVRWQAAAIVLALGLSILGLPIPVRAQAAPGENAQPLPLPPLPPPPPQAAPLRSGADLSLDTAVLQGLDKVTARIVTVEAPVGEPVHFGSLEIIARACKKRRPEDQPESAAFLDIWELRPGEPAASLFRGWMFASSPALSAMEHPVYDLWVMDCRNQRH
jgi:hypothetical protein